MVFKSHIKHANECWSLASRSDCLKKRNVPKCNPNTNRTSAAMHSLFVCFSRVFTEKVLYHSNFLLCFLRYSFVNIAIFNIIYKNISFSRWPVFGSRQDVLFKAFYLRQTSITTAKVCEIAFATHLLVMCVLLFWWKSSDNHNEKLLRLHNFTHACTSHSNCGLAFNPWFDVNNCANFTFPCSSLFL